MDLLNRYTVKSCIGGSNPPSPPDCSRLIIYHSSTESFIRSVRRAGFALSCC